VPSENCDLRRIVLGISDFSNKVQMFQKDGNKLTGESYKKIISSIKFKKILNRVFA